MSGHDKTQFLFALRPFEPEPGNGQEFAQSLQVNLANPLSLPAKLLEGAAIGEFAIAPHPNNGSPSPLTHYFDKLIDTTILPGYPVVA